MQVIFTHRIWHIIMTKSTCLPIDIVQNIIMFLFRKLDDRTRCSKTRMSWKKSSYLRKRLTIFLSVQVMGCSVSAGFCQILSRVTDELNKLKRENQIVLSTQHISEYSSPCSFNLTRSPLNKHWRIKRKYETSLQQCATWESVTLRSGTGFTWRVWHRGNRSWCDPESLSFSPLTKTRPLIQG